MVPTEEFVKQILVSCFEDKDRPVRRLTFENKMILFIKT